MFKKTAPFFHLLSIARIVTLIFITFLSLQLHAQVTPLEGSKLNYRIVGFSFPANTKATNYSIEIAKGNFNNKKDFTTHISQTIPSSKNQTIIEVPSFGNEYTWRVVYKNNNSLLSESQLFHFTTGTPPNPKNKLRLVTKNNIRKYSNRYILIDGNNVMYDMNGNPVWYFPDNDSLNPAGNSDLKVSPLGSITFLADNGAYDISYSGKILWKVKDKNTTTCHHEFSKLSNGHYMALIMGADLEPIDHKDGRKRFFPHADISTIVEFDKDGNTVWSWESIKYIHQSDLKALQEIYSREQIDMHENAFYFDEKNKVIYLGMSGINRIVKIQYPSGKVLAEYGTKYIADPQATPPSDQSILQRRQLLPNKLFSHEHTIARSDNGYLYVFDNNQHEIMNPAEKNSSYPQLLKLKEADGALEKVWDLNTEPLISADQKMLRVGGGGNLVLLPDNEIFVSMCMPYGDLYIVDSNKKVLWSAAPETYVPDNETWVRQGQYRASIVTAKQLEQLIWAEK